MIPARLRRGASHLFSLIKDTYERYDSRHGNLLAAAFAFYSLLSVAPLAVIAVAVAGLVVDPATARAALMQGVARASGRQIADVLVGLLEAAQSQGGGIGTVIALGLLLWAASRLFVVLQEALNTLWGLRPAADGGALSAVRRVAMKRLLSFAMVIGCGALLLSTLVAQTLISTVRGNLLDALGLGALHGPLALLQQLLLSLVTLTVAFALVFRWLPDARVLWRDAFVGALATGTLVLLGTALLSTYLSRIAPTWLQGAVGSIAAFMLWSYYLAQVFLLGATLTRVRATATGASLEPEPHAELAE